jgi:hypothetical protein
MMDKFFRSLLVGLVVASATLVGFGWNAYSKINNMGKDIKKEIKQEMMDVRNSDMVWIDKRFDTVEKLMVGKVITPPRPVDQENP